MEKFIKQLFAFILFTSIPFLIVFCGYLYFDPFKVINTYNDYSYPFVIPNRDYVSTEMFIKNYKKYHYNSFIFGSSRTIGYKPSSWKEYLSKDDVPFLFDASKESIYGIYTKLRYLDSVHVNIDNALIIICRDATFIETGNSSGHLYIKHPVVTRESRFDFQNEFFKAYVNPKFIFDFYFYKLTGTYRPFMAGVIENKRIKYDTISNQLIFLDREIEINNNPKHYYLDKKDVFYTRSGEKTDSVNRIKNVHTLMLNEIAMILKKHKTNYKIILSPLYEQIKFSPVDKRILTKIFGTNLYDFSGKNQFTESKTNYYENSHYRPIVGDSILKLIYQKKH
ncbi:MAG: hypothetical protein P0Y49_08635 [Candidatus Pedobacter colombiensis]|uniref:Uncharacterized protein n=1 Tax=Candidatus Pedobacter colombiensis TaxID=3121371 RepID=A0AAJ5WCN9_9SPHI|nr:hypothetical protein [Pedobacter sp.]WEK21206.1 MAG: hypothetical protein P0Y49_08635 [Pedobacter sp.]